MNFLFWLFFAGLAIAFAQDVKRREVDNWLNLFLLVSGSVYLIFSAKTSEQIFLVFIFILVFFALSNILYYCRFFAGGDAKLLFAMTPFFVAATFNLTFLNLGFFIFCLFLAGSVYGLSYTAILGIIHFKKMKKEVVKESKKLKLKYNLLLAFVFAIGGFFNSLFLIVAIFVLAFSLLFVYAKALEKVAMYRKVKSELLREGDWLVSDLKIGNRVFKANFDGLSKKEIELIKRKKKEVLIKEGLPFVPAFMIAFLLYAYFYDFFFNFLFSLFL